MGCNVCDALNNDAAGRVAQVHRYTLDGEGQPDESVLFAEYAYYETGQVERITYGNGAVVEYEYDDAERLKVIRHKASAQGTILRELEYAYNPRGLITRSL